MGEIKRGGALEQPEGKVEVNVKYINGVLEQLKQSAFTEIFPSYQSAFSCVTALFNLPNISMIRIICNSLYFFDNLLLVTLESFYWAFIWMLFRDIVTFQRGCKSSLFFSSNNLSIIFACTALALINYNNCDNNNSNNNKHRCARLWFQLFIGR